MSQWITDRLPTEADADCYGEVWNANGELAFWEEIVDIEAWQPTNCPGAYQSDKKHMDDDMWYTAKNIESGLYSVHSVQRGQLCEGIASLEEARKIAAAPDLLEALKVCAAHIGNMPHPDFVNGGPIDIVYAQALQAIAKAEGRQADREEPTP